MGRRERSLLGGAAVRGTVWGRARPSAYTTQTVLRSPSETTSPGNVLFREQTKYFITQFWNAHFLYFKWYKEVELQWNIDIHGRSRRRIRKSQTFWGRCSPSSEAWATLSPSPCATYGPRKLSLHQRLIKYKVTKLRRGFQNQDSNINFDIKIYP